MSLLLTEKIEWRSIQRSVSNMFYQHPSGKSQKKNIAFSSKKKKNLLICLNFKDIIHSLLNPFVCKCFFTTVSGQWVTKGMKAGLYFFLVCQKQGYPKKNLSVKWKILQENSEGISLKLYTQRLIIYFLM